MKVLEITTTVIFKIISNMKFQHTSQLQKDAFNKVATHPLQAYEWGEFRKKTGLKVIREAFVENKVIQKSFQLTIHKIPKLHYNIGYLPKGFLPTEELLGQLHTIGKKNNCVFMQLEPNVQAAEGKTEMELLMQNSKFTIKKSHRP